MWRVKRHGSGDGVPFRNDLLPRSRTWSNRRLSVFQGSLSQPLRFAGLSEHVAVRVVNDIE